MRCPFELDPQIIHHIIYSQAGSIGKAVIELIMNSVDAGAKQVNVDITAEGFACRDDGRGFASHEDVKRYFGRFGTPHQEGDATYGRFRLGRGQIMAHARTLWRSNLWQMSVDTREMGYHYDLDELTTAVAGCSVTGEWYEPLNSQERLSCLQEIRDLVRYTPVIVSLNGAVITRQPALEKWDAEDDEAWYRLREEGAVAIYNQGVLVRHDPGHQWGVGGLIVSKKPLALNVSRTEILRKSCPVWKSIAARFAEMAGAFADTQGSHRKTESRREKSARMLLAGEGDLQTLFNGEEVITLLPGRQHVTLEAFLRRCRRVASADGQWGFTLVRSARDVPRGELIARAGIAPVLHHVTLTRFGCYEEDEFMVCLNRIRRNLLAYREGLARPERWGSGWHADAVLIDFATLSANFIDRTRVVSEKQLDKETRRAWTALRWCLSHYAALCTGAKKSWQAYTRGGTRFQMLLGESTTSEAWTDGETYIAFNIDIVRRLKMDPLLTASRLFSLTEHEVAHQGDSLDCGHDEAFYQRFHDISTLHASDRQRYLHVWLMKYTTSLEAEGKRAAGSAWRERYLTERASTGREKKGLPGIISDEGMAQALKEPDEPEDAARLALLNAKLTGTDTAAPANPDWDRVVKEGIELALKQQLEQAQQRQINAQEWEAYMCELDSQEAEMAEAGPPPDDEMDEMAEEQRARYLTLLPGATAELLTDYVVWYLIQSTTTVDEELDAWARRTWQQAGPYRPVAEAEQLPERWKPQAREGETRWSLKRNAAAAGFLDVEDYLQWRQDNDSGA
ncbi:ATP-binding protein [Erwinia papayae]|uniref:ATP-binding protein n=1 Tax=Erwinia papayae TaxID=206499 RepID=A0ABV3MYD8_9GAMM